jgi:hypothetical protein
LARLGLGLARLGLGLARLELGLVGLGLGLAGLGLGLAGLELEHSLPIRWRLCRPIRWRLCRPRRLVSVAAVHDLRTHAFGAVLLRRPLCLSHGPRRSLRQRVLLPFQ